eukprot:SAG22_NODE_353_length_11812_cov_58.910783_6_plen_31_part_00
MMSGPEGHCCMKVSDILAMIIAATHATVVS